LARNQLPVHGHVVPRRGVNCVFEVLLRVGPVTSDLGVELGAVVVGNLHDRNRVPDAPVLGNAHQSLHRRERVRCKHRFGARVVLVDEDRRGRPVVGRARGQDVLAVALGRVRRSPDPDRVYAQWRKGRGRGRRWRRWRAGDRRRRRRQVATRRVHQGRSRAG
jgi:hypothetical protein